MKAKDYAEKYIPKIRDIKTDDDMLLFCHELYKEYAVEAQKIIIDRNVKFDSAVISVFREQNKKWNAMVRLFENAGLPVIKRDGFINLVKDQLNNNLGLNTERNL